MDRAFKKLFYNLCTGEVQLSQNPLVRCFQLRDVDKFLSITDKNPSYQIKAECIMWLYPVNVR